MRAIGRMTPDASRVPHPDGQDTSAAQIRTGLRPDRTALISLTRKPSLWSDRNLPGERAVI